MSADVLHQFVIYRNPADYPDKVVVRRWSIGAAQVTPDAAPLTLVDTVEAARAALPPGLVCLGREPGDDPVIVEVWT